MSPSNSAAPVRRGGTPTSRATAVKARGAIGSRS